MIADCVQKPRLEAIGSDGDAHDMYDEIVIGPRGGDEAWVQDHVALVTAWQADGIVPEPILRFSSGADHVGSFLFLAGTIALQPAFGALKIWLKGRAGRGVHIRLADGTEISARDAAEIDRMAGTLLKLRQGREDRDTSDGG